MGEQNVNGFFAYVVPQFKYISGGNTLMMEAIVLHKPVSDINDVISRQVKVSATLLEGGTAIEIQEPSLPWFLTEETEEIYQDMFDDDQTWMTEAIKDAHRVNVNTIQGSELRKKKIYTFILPEGYRGATGFMNSGGQNTSPKGLKLTPFLYSGSEVLSGEETGTDEEMTFTKCMVSFVIPLESYERRVVEMAENEFQPVHKMFRKFQKLTMDQMATDSNPAPAPDQTRSG